MSLDNSDLSLESSRPRVVAPVRHVSSKLKLKIPVSNNQRLTIKLSKPGVCKNAKTRLKTRTPLVLTNGSFKDTSARVEKGLKSRRSRLRMSAGVAYESMRPGSSMRRSVKRSIKL